MFEVTAAAKAAKIASYDAAKLESLRAWSVRERDLIAPAARPLMASIPDRALRDIARTIDDRAAADAAGGALVPHLGRVPADQIHMIRGWVVGEVKSRHVVEWHAASDVQEDLLTDYAALAQGVERDAVDWDAVSHDWPGWDYTHTAYELALLELGPTSGQVLAAGLREIQAELAGVAR